MAVLLDPPATRRRLRAMRALTAPTPAEQENRTGRGDPEGGISVRELARRLESAQQGRGLGFDTLTDIERGKRNLHLQEARSIAEVCGIPYEFFTFDLAELAVNRALEERIATIERRLGLDYAELEDASRGLSALGEQPDEHDPPSGDTPPPAEREQEGDRSHRQERKRGG